MATLPLRKESEHGGENNRNEKKNNSPAPDPDAQDQQDQQSRRRAASSLFSKTAAADQVETEDELSIKRKNILVNEVERIFAKEQNHKFDWISILGFKERDMDRRKRALLLILHPDKSGKFAKHAGGEERLKTYDFVDVAYLQRNGRTRRTMGISLHGKGILFLKLLHNPGSL